MPCGVPLAIQLETESFRRYFKTIKFPGGELHTVLPDSAGMRDEANVTFYARIQSPDDLIELMLAVDIVHRLLPVANLHLVLPYFPYARQDRCTEVGGAFSLKELVSIVEIAHDLNRDVLEFVKAAHGTQTRNNGEPYWHHPIEVARRLQDEDIWDPITINAAMCHDVLEDTDRTYADILALTNKETADVVQELTNLIPPDADKIGELKHKALFEHARKYSDRAKIIKIMDRYCNVADSIYCWQPHRVKRYAKYGLELIEAMQPMPDVMKAFEKEAIRLMQCIV